MKTAGRGNPNRWVTVPNNRAHGAEGQNRSCSITWAEKQEKFQPTQECFFLTSTFIELTNRDLAFAPRNMPLSGRHSLSLSGVQFERAVTGTAGRK